MITGNDSAIPFIEQTGNPEIWNTISGITIRQYYAGLAMQGLMQSIGHYYMNNTAELAHDSVIAADALIEELNKTEK